MSSQVIKEVDARGLSCPEPVLRTRRALDEIDSGIVVVLVDAEVSKENVSRMARRMGCEVEVEEYDGGYKLTITKS